MLPALEHLIEFRDLGAGAAERNNPLSGHFGVFGDSRESRAARNREALDIYRAI